MAANVARWLRRLIRALAGTACGDGTFFDVVDMRWDIPDALTFQRFGGAQTRRTRQGLGP